MTTNWKIDPSHSEVEFKVKHLMITTITGYFEAYDLNVTTSDDDFSSTSKIEFSADVNSINTKNSQRDEHLKSDEFFDAIKYPTINFSGAELTKKPEGFTLMGDLTIKGNTHQVTLKAAFEGVIVDPYGQVKAGFTISGKISRKEFGLLWNPMTEAGQIVVGDEIKINCSIQLIKMTN